MTLTGRPVRPRIRCSTALPYRRGNPRLDDPALVRVNHHRDPIAQIELAQNPGDMGLHGLLRDVEFASDLGVGPAANDLQKHLMLAAGQGLARHPHHHLGHGLHSTGWRAPCLWSYGPSRAVATYTPSVWMDYSASAALTHNLVACLLPPRRSCSARCVSAGS